MFAAALIVFRETLEAAMIIAIIAAATQGLSSRGRWISVGILSGILGASIVAIFASFIANIAEGTGQELMNAGILFAAVIMIAWHVVWMSSHGREIAGQMRNAGVSISEGRRHLSALAVIVGLAVMREGSEVVLILQGLMTGSATPSLMMTGAGLGLGAGALLGGLMYAGFLALPLQRVFTLSNSLLVLIAAGMSARGINFLVQAGWISSFSDNVWNTSNILSEQSILGQILGALVGYIANPSSIQLIAYGATILLILSLLGLQHTRRSYRIASLTVSSAIVLSIICLWPTAAAAASVKSPYVVQGEAEFEHAGTHTFDDNAEKDDGAEYEFEVAYGVTSFWKVEVEAEFEQEPRGESDASLGLQHKKIAWENTAQLSESGEYWLDPAAYFAAAWGQNGEADAVTGGIILGKDIGPVSNKANLFLKHELGDRADEGTNFIYRWQSVYRLTPWIQPGFEIFGETKAHTDFDDQNLSAGPVLVGKLPGFTNGQAFKYEVGYQIGATRNTADGEARWKLEYEFFF